MSVSVKNRNRDTVPFPRVIHAVFTKENWTDPWVAEQYLRCTKATHVAGPDVDQSDLFYQWGSIKREDATDFDDYDPIDLNDKYIQVRLAVVPDGAAKKRKNNMTPIFTGVGCDDARLRLGQVAGDQTEKAFGMAHVLDRTYLDYGYVLEPDTGSGETVKLGYVPKFNDKGQWGRALLGNRSTTQNPNATSSYDYVYLFSNKPDAGIWNARQAIDFVLGFASFAQATPCVLSGQVAALEIIEGVWDINGKSVLQFLNEIISRKHGLGFSLEIKEGGTDDGQDLLQIRVFTLVDKSVAIEDKVFPGNDNAQPFYFGDAASGVPYPTSHLVDNLLIRTTTIQQYDDIYVRGAFVKMCFSVSFGNETLDRGWLAALQEKYDNADGASDATRADICDNVRATDRFKHVYRHFVIPKDFGWRVGWGTAETDPDHGADELSNIAPTTCPDGSVVFDDDFENNDELFVHRWTSTFGKELFRDLPFEKGKDYSEIDESGEPVDNNESDAVPEYQPMFAWVYDDQHGYHHGPPKSLVPAVGEDEPVDWYYRLDTLTQSFPSLHGMHDAHIRAIDREMGLEITAGYNHYLALNTFPWDATHAAAHPPDFDFERIGATVMVQSDGHLFVRKQFDLSGESVKTLTVDVPDAEYWYVHPSTTVDVKEGKLITINENLTVLRDDSYKLRSVAELLCLWYGVQRRAVSIPIKQLGFYSKVGDFLWTMEILDDAPEVNTVVTSIAWDLDNQATTIETSYAALDGVGIVEGMMPGKGFAGRKGAATKGQGGDRAKGGRR